MSSLKHERERAILQPNPCVPVLQLVDFSIIYVFWLNKAEPLTFKLARLSTYDIYTSESPQNTHHVSSNLVLYVAADWSATSCCQTKKVAGSGRQKSGPTKYFDSVLFAIIMVQLIETHIQKLQLESYNLKNPIFPWFPLGEGKAHTTCYRTRK